MRMPHPSAATGGHAHGYPLRPLPRAARGRPRGLNARPPGPEGTPAIPPDRTAPGAGAHFGSKIGQPREKELRQIRSAAYRRAQEVRGKADAEATKIYGTAYNRDPEFYAFSRTLEAYKEGQNKNSVLILTTDSDYYRYLKDAAGRIPGAARAAR
jgi:hypothetical protein